MAPVRASYSFTSGGAPASAPVTMKLTRGTATVSPLPNKLFTGSLAVMLTGPDWGTVMLVWSIGTGTFDNVLRPILIKRGADLPLVLIFAGVLGGLLAFGLIGLFVGPVVLAVTYTLLEAWVTGAEAPRAHITGFTLALNYLPLAQLDERLRSRLHADQRLDVSQVCLEPSIGVND